MPGSEGGEAPKPQAVEVRSSIEATPLSHPSNHPTLPDQERNSILEGTHPGLKAPLPESLRERAEAGLASFSPDAPFTQTPELILEQARNIPPIQLEKLPPGATMIGQMVVTPNRGEGPPQPPEINNPEWEASPERGRSLAEEILRMETALPYEVRYNAENGPKLNRLYKELQLFVRGKVRTRNEREDWDAHEAYEELESHQEHGNNHEAQAQPEDLNGLRPINQLTTQYEDPATPPDQLPEIERQLGIYFKEAQRLGLLKGVDQILTSLYKNIEGGASESQIRRALPESLAQAENAAEIAFGVRRKVPGVTDLYGIWRPYMRWATERFENALTGQDQPPNREGELDFSHNEDEEDRNTYWEPGPYPKSYHVTAKTPEQFRIAVETFLEMATNGSLGKSPDELYHHFESFKDAVGQVGSVEIRAKNVTEEFMEELRTELEAHAFIFGADYSNETYNPESYYKFMDAMARHEGPQRWVGAARAGEGAVGAFLWKFDYDPRVVLFHNTGGSRGQLSSDTVAQHYLQQQIKEILIEEAIGINLKSYDPRDTDPESPFKLLTSKKADAERAEYLKKNAERIGIHQTTAQFKGLYEGFDQGNGNIVNFQTYGNRNLADLPKGLRRSVELGRIQLELRRHREEVRAGRESIKKGKTLLDLLSDKDKEVYKSAFNQTKANFEIAFQMVGATGEKVRRGGGVLLIDREVNGVKFVDYMPNYLAEKYVQYAENRAKIQFANASAVERTAAVEQARASAIAQIKKDGFEAKLKVPKILFDEHGEVTGIGPEEEINFNSATESIFSRWTSHTYLGYQQENRHMILDPDIFAAAKRIRAGISRSEDEDPLATMLLILDPTLKQVSRLEDDNMRPGESAQAAEVILMEAAVESSNQRHWQIVRDIAKEFMAEDGNVLKMRMGYNLEDYGGQSRFILRIRNFFAVHQKRFARRYASELANSPMNISSMPDIWGQEGVLGAVEMFADPIGAIAEQRVASQFAITKFVDQMHLAWTLFGALGGHVDQNGASIEGLFEKPTNNSDKLIQTWDKLKTAGTKQEEAENNFFYAVMESFGRLDKVLKIVRTMESDTRNAQGALWLDNPKHPIEAFLPNGKVNPEIGTDRDTGSSRHTERIFFDSYINWLLSPDPGGGMAAYPSEVKLYAFLKQPYFYIRADGGIEKPGRTWADWLFDKMAR